LINGVKVTFFQFPYQVEFNKRFAGIIRISDLLTLAAMKAFAIGQRAKWKDYVDLYFIMNKYHGIDQIVKKAEELFGKEFNEKIFRTQLAYLDDVSYEEEVIYMPGFAVSDKIIKTKLIEFSLS